MGEVADLILDGVLYEGFGVFVGDEVGFPRKCRDCERLEERGNPFDRVPCPICGKKVAREGLEQHSAAKHGPAGLDPD